MDEGCYKLLNSPCECVKVLAVALGHAAIANPDWPNRAKKPGFTPKRPPLTPAELIDRGVAELTVMRDRAMREWVTVQIEDEDEWEPVMRTAHAFVDSITPPLPAPEE